MAEQLFYGPARVLIQGFFSNVVKRKEKKKKELAGPHGS